MSPGAAWDAALHAVSNPVVAFTIVFIILVIVISIVLYNEKKGARKQ